MSLLVLMVLVLGGLPGSLEMLEGDTWILLWLHVGCSVLRLAFCSLTSVQKQWSGILLLQAAAAVHIGIDNLYVLKHVVRIIQGLAPL